MPRLESQSESLFITSRSSSGPEGILANVTNGIPRNTRLDENTYTPQGAGEMENPAVTRQGDVSPASNENTHSVSTALPTPLSQASSRLTIAKVIITSPSRPTKKTELLSETLATEISSLTKLVESVSPQAAGHVLQNCWRKFFLSDDSNDHLYWALRTGIQDAPRALIESLLKDQSTLEVLLPVAREQQAVIQAVLNNITYDELFKHTSNDVLDRVISLRLKTIPAKSLIRWLAEAERLGFQEDDILDDDDESAVPNISIPESSAMQASYVNGRPALGLSAPNSVASGSGHISVNDYSPGKDVEMAHPRPVEQDLSQIAANPPNEGQNYHHHATTTPSTINTSNNTPLTCPLCYFVFAHRSCYLYHLNKKVCKKPPPPAGYDWRCDNCGQGFKTRQGMNYHVYLNKVCFDGDITPATAPPQHNNQVAMNPQQRNFSDRILPPPRPSFYASQQLQPQYRAPLPAPSPQSGGQSYRHLSTGGVISKPPLHTPNHNRPRGVQTGPLAGDQATSSFQPRMSPSELSPLRLAELNQALAKQEAKYQAQVAAIDPSISLQERAARLQSLKNGHATKKSQIRKAFNVTLRMGDKDKAARSAVMTTPVPGLNFEEYRANPNHTPRVPPPQTSESIPDRSPALNLHSSSFSPINSTRTNEQNRYGSQPMSQRSSTLSSPVSRSVQETSYEVHPRRRDIPPSPVEKYPPQAHKRQRTDSGASPTYTNSSLPNPAQAQSQPLTAGPGDKACPRDSASREVYNDEAIQSSSGTGPTNIRTRITGPSTANNNNNNNEPIEVLSSSESSGGGNIVPQEQPGPMPRVAGRADEGSARGLFTAKRGKH